MNDSMGDWVKKNESANEMNAKQRSNGATWSFMSQRSGVSLAVDAGWIFALSFGAPP